MICINMHNIHKNEKQNDEYEEIKYHVQFWGKCVCVCVYLEDRDYVSKTKSSRRKIL